MRPDEQALKEDGFRTSLLGGFDKNDVLAYMNALANEMQQHEAKYQQDISQMQEQMETLRRERQAANSQALELQKQLAELNARLAEAEKRAADAGALQERAEKQAAGYRSQCADRDQAIELLRTRNAELQKQADAATEAPRPVLPGERPALRPRPQDTLDTAKVEARRILEDAKLYARNSEQQMRQEAEAQKERMAENARGIAAGAMLLQDHLSRADEKISAATQELENVTSVIYKALDETFADLEGLGVQLRDYAEGTPELDVPAQVPAAPPAPQAPAAAAAAAEPAARPTVRARAVYRVKSEPKPASQHRLRTTHGRRSSAQNLEEAIGRVGDET